MKVTCARRLPPGDRWQMGNDTFESLTECLNQIYLTEGVTSFEVNAGKKLLKHHLRRGIYMENV